MKRQTSFWWVQLPGWFLLIYLIYAQAIPAFDYDIGIKMGTQESAEQITQVGVAFWYGFAFADLVVYIPMLMTGLIAHWFGKVWGKILLVAASGITLYWPVVSLAAIIMARDATGWNLTNEQDYWIVLPLITLWGGWLLFHLLREVCHTSD